MIIQKIFGYLLFTGLILSLNSCEKNDETYSSEKLVLKSQEIEAYLYDEYNGLKDYTMIVPVKIYARGGSPDHSSGDYKFRLAKGSVLPEGLIFDTINGVITGGGQLKDKTGSSDSFEIEVTDGINYATAKYTLINRSFNNKLRNKVPVMQFSAPETNLLCDANTCCYGVSLSMLGGFPPYTFALHEGDDRSGGINP